MMINYYQNKVAVVTGAASGLGLGYVKRLLINGAQAVWMCDYNQKTLTDEAEALLSVYPGRVFPVVGNVMAREEVEGLIAHAVKDSGRIDLLFNNAGKPMTAPTEQLDVKDFEALVQLNLMGVVYGILAALPHMLAQGSGHMINTASCGGLFPAPCQTAYAATKSAVITMTRCLHYEYADAGLFFSHVSPMNVATNIFKVSLEKKWRDAGLPEDEISKRVAQIKPPEGAMPLEDALDYIMEHIASRDVDIILGQDGRDLYGLMSANRPAFDSFLLDIGRKRRAYFAAKARGEDVPFPG